MENRDTSSSSMSRDFLSLSAPQKNQNMEESLSHFMASSKENNVFLANVPMQWPYTSKASALQQFITIKNLQEGAKKSSFEKLSGFPAIATADAYNLNKNQACVQGNFRLDSAGRNTAEPGQFHPQQIPLSRQYGVARSAYLAQAFDERNPSNYNFNKMGSTFPGSNRLFTIPNLVSPAYFKGEHPSTPQHSGPMSGQGGNFPFVEQHSLPVMENSAIGTKPGVPEKQPTAQLTVFYAGSVHVYDNVPADKAQALMFLAGSESSWSGKAINAPPISSVVPVSVSNANQMMHSTVTSVVPTFPNGISLSYPKAAMSHNSQAQNNIMQGTQPNGPMLPNGISLTYQKVPTSQNSLNQNTTIQSNQPVVPMLSNRISLSYQKPPTPQNSQIPTTVTQSSQPTSTNSEPAQTKESTQSSNDTQSAPKTNVIGNSVGSTTPSLAPRVPIARKASLARFLEKRKERAQMIAPYTLKKSEESAGGENPITDNSLSKPTSEEGSNLKKNDEPMACCEEKKEQSRPLKPVKIEIQDCE